MTEPVSRRHHWRQWASPAYFDDLARRLVPVFATLAVIGLAAGFYLGFFLAPVDAVQGENYRIIYLHVPTSWMAMIIYLAMAFWSAVYLVWHTHLSAMLTRALAPTGALMTFLSLVTGALWGKPTWGTYWVWDARLTSMLLLFLLYLGFMALTGSIRNEKRSFAAGSMVALVGAFNVPLIYFSVSWWNTLHQGASISFERGVQMHDAMLAGLLLMTAGVWCYCIAIVLARVRVAIRARQAR